jgi:uroporphyrinogen-III decarboxylase
MTLHQEMSDSQWNQLTTEQKREYRIYLYLNPTHVTFTNDDCKKAYQTRAKRLVDVYNLQEPDQVPLALHIGSLPLQYAGLDYYSGIQDYSKAVQIYNEFNRKYADELDNFANVYTLMPGQPFETLDYKMYSWPGHGLPKNASGYQFREGEYMKVSEYHYLIDDPSDFWLRFYIPRIFGAMECLHNVGPMTELIEIPTANLMPLTTAPVQKMLEDLLKAGKELQQRSEIQKTQSVQAVASGFPPLVDYLGLAPFDIIGDTLRGTQGIMMDMYRCPDKLLAALDVLTNLQIKNVIERANRTKGLVVTFPLHKGADGWMSQKQFEKFYWPSLKKTIDAFIAEGLIVNLFAEGSYNSRLDSVNDFPKGAIHWWFDKTDIIKAKQMLGDKCSISGNVPSSVLMKGTPDEVKAYCRNLIEACGKGGGYILSEGAAEVEAKIENLQAMAVAAKEYGVYKR